MGRELRRVPLDFDWPIGKIWEGYLNPFWQYRVECSKCLGSGYSPRAKRYRDEWYGYVRFIPYVPLDPDHPSIHTLARRHIEQSPEYYGSLTVDYMRECNRLFQLFRYKWCYNLNQDDVTALIEANRLWEFTRVPKNLEQEAQLKEQGGGWLREWNGYTPTAAEVNAWSMLGIGHDSINASVCVTTRCKRNGVGINCLRCNGDGDIWPPGVRQEYENWKEAPPPTGEGYQLWNTTTEGHPQSPVFESLDALCAWCADNATTFASNKATADDWKRMLSPGGLVSHTEGNLIFI